MKLLRFTTAKGSYLWDDREHTVYISPEFVVAVVPSSLKDTKDCAVICTVKEAFTVTLSVHDCSMKINKG